MRTKPFATQVLVFDEVELLDVAGPISVLSAAGRAWNFQPFKIDLVAAELCAVSTRSGIALQPTRTLATSSGAECLIIPGGYGARKAAQEPALVDWLRRSAAAAEFVLIVGNGALVAAAAGLLDQAEVAVAPDTSAEVRAACATVRLNLEPKVCESGRLLSVGRSALGLDLACELVLRTFGKKLASGLSAALGVDWPGELSGLEIVPAPPLGAVRGPLEK